MKTENSARIHIIQPWERKALSNYRVGKEWRQLPALEKWRPENGPAGRKKAVAVVALRKRGEFDGFRPGQPIFSHLSAALIFFVTFLDQAKKVRQRKNGGASPSGKGECVRMARKTRTMAKVVE